MNSQVNLFLQSVLREYSKDNHKDSKGKVYDLLERERVYMESRKWDEEKISELETENVLLKNEIEELKQVKEKKINYAKVDKLEEEIEYLQDVCVELGDKVSKRLERKKMTKQLKVVESKLKKLKERLSKGLLP